MKDKVFVDANFIISLKDTASIMHDNAKVLMGTLKIEKLIVSPYVINEVHYFYGRYYNLKEAEKVVAEIFNLGINISDIILNAKNILEIARISSKHNLRTFNAFHAYYCKKLGIKYIATFDSDFKKIPWVKIYIGNKP